MRKQDVSARLHDVIQGKKKWRAHMARVQSLPQDYQIVYHEIQNYFFKVGPVDPTDGTDLLSGILDLFQEGAAAGKGVLQVTGRDVAAFCDELIKDTKTFADLLQESVAWESGNAMKKVSNKSK